NADGNEKKAAFEIDAVALLVVDPGLLDLGFALVVLAHDGVLDLDFRVQRQALVETVVEPEYEARLICGGITALPKFAVRGFAVADDVRRAVGEARASVEHRAVVERIRRRRLRRRRRVARLLRLQLIDLLLKDLQLLIDGLTEHRGRSESGSHGQ